MNHFDRVVDSKVIAAWIAEGVRSRAPAVNRVESSPIATFVSRWRVGRAVCRAV